jgi:Serine aminopeptidase, S33
MSFFGKLGMIDRRRPKVFDARKSYTQEIKENYKQTVLLRLALLQELSEQYLKTESKLELHLLNELRKVLVEFSYELVMNSSVLSHSLFSTYVESMINLDQSPTIVFVHGHDQNSSTWHQYMFQLRDIFDVVSYDRVGYGLSESKSLEFSLDEQIIQLQIVIERIQSKKSNQNILFISNGFGSYIVEQFIQREVIPSENICTSVMISYGGEFAKSWQENHAIRYKKRLLTQRNNSQTLSKAYKPDVLLQPLLKNIRGSDRLVLNPIESNYLLSELKFIVSVRKTQQAESMIPEIFIALENDFITTPEQVKNYFDEHDSQNRLFYVVSGASDTSIQGHPSAILNKFFPAIHKYSSEVSNSNLIQQLSLNSEHLALVDKKYGITTNLSGIISQLRSLETPIDLFYHLLAVLKK